MRPAKEAICWSSVLGPLMAVLFASCPQKICEGLLHSNTSAFWLCNHRLSTQMAHL